MLLGLDSTCRLGGASPTGLTQIPGCRLTRPLTPVPASACPLHLRTSLTFLVIVANLTNLGVGVKSAIPEFEQGIATYTYGMEDSTDALILVEIQENAREAGQK